MVNNSSDINKTKNHLSPKIIEYKRGYKFINILKLIKYIDRNKCLNYSKLVFIYYRVHHKKTGSLDLRAKQESIWETSKKQTIFYRFFPHCNMSPYL